MAHALKDALSELRGKDVISDEDVLTLRRAVYEDGQICIAEADAIFEISDAAGVKSESFGEFFMETMTDFVVRQSLPYGYVDAANSAWLIARIGKDGIVETLTELRTLVNILKTATDSTDRLVAFALGQVKEAVLNGRGVMGRGRKLESGRITATDVEMLRTVLYACGGDGHIAISRSEAEILFDLNDATRGADNDPEWQKLFVQGLANYLMYLTTYETPDREEALRRERWLGQRGDLTLGNMVKRLKFKDIADAFMGRDGRADDAAKASLQERRIELAEHIDPEEAAWLSSRIGRDGTFDDNEKALMEFLKAESPYLHVTLEPLLNAA